jgi:2'-5' RNA ligase
VKSNRKIRELLALAGARQVPASPFVVTELVLMKSELYPAGARYTPMARAPLRGKSPGAA